MIIINALIPALLAGFVTIILGSVINYFYPSYGWDTIFGVSAGVTTGNFIMYLIFNNVKF